MTRGAYKETIANVIYILFVIYIVIYLVYHAYCHENLDRMVPFVFDFPLSCN